MIAVQNCVVQSGLSRNPLFLYPTDYSSVFGFEILIAHHVPKVCVTEGCVRSVNPGSTSVLFHPVQLGITD